MAICLRAEPIGYTVGHTGGYSYSYLVNKNTNKIISVGQISNEGSQAGKVYSTDGIFPTICACTHGYAIGNILIDKYKH